KSIGGVVGYASDPAIAEQLHTLGHKGAVEYVVVQREDTLRRRLRVCSDKGTECLVALPREEQLSDGAVLLLEPDLAIVTRMAEEQWLGVRPGDMSSAVELGYFVGNLHWRVRFDGPVLYIALEGPERDYLDRLQPFLGTQRASIEEYKNK
ncbi:urease accessory protein UreE, partial [Pseudomonadota bacterium]